MARERLTAQARKKQIVDAAIKLSVKKGYYRLTIRDIEEGTGIGRSLISYHFTIDELRKAIVVEAIKKDIPSILSQAASVNDPVIKKHAAKLKRLLLKK